MFVFWWSQVLAIVGGQFTVGNEVCGAVISIRYNEDILSVWTRTSQDRDAKLKIQYVFRRFSLKHFQHIQCIQGKSDSTFS